MTKNLLLTDQKTRNLESGSGVTYSIDHRVCINSCLSRIRTQFRPQLRSRRNTVNRCKTALIQLSASDALIEDGCNIVGSIRDAPYQEIFEQRHSNYRDLRPSPSIFYTVNHKKCDILFLTITLADLNRLLSLEGVTPHLFYLSDLVSPLFFVNCPQFFSFGCHPLKGVTGAVRPPPDPPPLGKWWLTWSRLDIGRVVWIKAITGHYVSLFLWQKLP